MNKKTKRERFLEEKIMLLEGFIDNIELLVDDLKMNIDALDSEIYDEEGGVD